MQPDSKKKENANIGRLGEDLAARFLESRGFVILDRNYLKKFGEVDIVAKYDHTIHFVEVKTVSHETRADVESAISRETWRPEEMVHRHKLHQISKAVQAWMSENSYTGNIQIDVIAIRIVPRETYSTINYIENVIIDE